MQDLSIPALDGYRLAASFYPSQSPRALALISSATAVKRGYYRHFAGYLQEHGFSTLTYDYRGIGDSRPPGPLRGFSASMRDWALCDMPAALDWLRQCHSDLPVVLVGHSFGGQVAGMLGDTDRVAAMLTTSSQSGYWRLQGRGQKLAVALHMHITFPLLSRLLGYFPWSWFSSAEDLPGPAAREWAAWCRHPDYLLGDRSLPLARFGGFTQPVLALSFDDDDWGTARSVDAMMRAYPRVERRHLVPRQHGLDRIGHFGFYRSSHRALWNSVREWMEAQIQAPTSTAP